MRMLVIEGEARLRAFLTRAFEAEGFTVDATGDGDDAIARVLRTTYELVILDPMLPSADGLEVLARIHDQRPQLPVLLLSERTDLATKLRGFELGAVDYVAKPFSLEELIARTRVQVRRARG